MNNRIVSHYKIIKEQGRGGMGVVYQAQDLDLDRMVAMKFLPPELSRDPDSKARFINEAKAASKLQHDNICTIHEIAQTEDGQMYIVMDYYEGKTLKEILIETREKMSDSGVGNHLPIQDAIEIAIQSALGLQAAHSRSIIHRDIKPSNIIITKDKKVKILDFGLARSVEHSGVTRTGQTPGTLAYMSPEQATGGKVDHRTDIWSLGVLLYEMIAGERPFETDIGPALIYLITTEQPRRLTNIRREIPDALDRIIRRALEKNPEKRYATTEEMLQELQQAKEHIASGGDSKARQMMRRMRRLHVAIPVIVGLLIIVTGIIWLFHRQSKITWAREVLVPQMAKYAGDGNYLAAMADAKEIMRYDPSNARLEGVLNEITQRYSMTSDPPGAKVFWKPYSRPDTAWEFLGTTPIINARILLEKCWIKIEKEGFRSRFLTIWALFGVPGAESVIRSFTLDSIGNAYGDMVRLKGDKYEAYLTGFKTRSRRDLGYIELGEFLLDRYEATNREYKRFVDAGGYETEKYWKYRFIRKGLTIPWRQVMSEFLDRTGRPGPSTWEGGTYPEGMEHYPVGGLSWYEAAAYAEYSGKRLPTVNHIGVAGIWAMAADFISSSNLAGRSLAQVGAFNSLGPYGTYDLGGNIREWAWNPEGEERYILGGSWKDPAYMYFVPRKAHAFDRSPENGFRCMIGLNPEADQPETWDTLFASVPSRRYVDEKPVDDRTFSNIRKMFEYEKTDLHPKLESRDSSHPEWIRECVSIDAAYNGDRFCVYFLIPRSGVPPYQSVIYYPCRDAFEWKTSADHLELYFTSFIVANGRVVVFPVFKGTYERQTTGINTTALYRDELVMRCKDLSRTIDYIETRNDFDPHKIAYESYSWGGPVSIMSPAIEPRLKASVLVAGGFSQGKVPKEFPEIDIINYAPRIKSPLLMVTGEYDMLFPYETSQKPAFLIFGTPIKDKKHALLKTDHIIPKLDAAREILPWLDKVFGPVKKKPHQ